MPRTRNRLRENPTTLRQCSKCGAFRRRTLAHFPRDVYMVDGMSSQCRGCRSQATMASRAKKQAAAT